MQGPVIAAGGGLQGELSIHSDYVCDVKSRLKADAVAMARSRRDGGKDKGLERTPASMTRFTTLVYAFLANSTSPNLASVGKVTFSSQSKSWYCWPAPMLRYWGACCHQFAGSGVFRRTHGLSHIALVW